MVVPSTSLPTLCLRAVGPFEHLCPSTTEESSSIVRNASFVVVAAAAVVVPVPFRVGAGAHRLHRRPYE